MIVILDRLVGNIPTILPNKHIMNDIADRAATHPGKPGKSEKV